MFLHQPDRMRWWLVFTLVGMVMGVVLEILAATVPFWSYNPRWIMFFVVFLAFGLSPSSLALLLRKQGLLVLFIVGSVLAFLVEGLSAIIPKYGWVFAEGFPLGIKNAFWRTVALGIGGGIFILAAYGVTYLIFTWRTRSIKKS